MEREGCDQCRNINLVCNYSGGFCTDSCSLIYCLQLQAAVSNSSLFHMHYLNQSNGVSFVESDRICNYLGHLYYKERCNSKEGTKPVWLSLVQCNPSYK